jgi:hypothetical protein
MPCSKAFVAFYANLGLDIAAFSTNTGEKWSFTALFLEEQRHLSSQDMQEK